MPKNVPTYLRTLNNCLSGRSKKVFPNQVVFYNAVFGATNPMILPENLVEEVKRIGQGDRRAEDEPLIKQVNYLLRSGLDSNSANVGKHINNASELPIPKQHKNHYLDEKNRSNIVNRLQAVLWFSIAFHPGRYRLEEADFAELLVQMKEELSEGSMTLAGADELTVELLANIVYEILSAHLTRLQEPYYPVPEKVHRIDLDAQRQEFLHLADCYGTYNADRFFALKRLAEMNVWAAAELGNSYYYGVSYKAVNEGEGNNGVLKIDSDKDMAARYYKMAATCNPPLVSACWSLGYMIFNRMFEDISEEDADELAMGYFRYAMEQEYLPAFNSVGLMELRRAREYWQQKTRTDTEQENMLAGFIRGLEMCDKAGCGGWVYGHINVAEWLSNPAFGKEIWPQIQDKVHLQGPVQVRERWKAAADLNNLWAMNQLALYDYRNGDLYEAEETWKRAASVHYSEASLNLALHIYGAGKSKEDIVRYRLCLEQASSDGSARASYELAQSYSGENSFTTAILLNRAEEQNYQKFNNILYHQIKNLRQRTGLE